MSEEVYFDGEFTWCRVEDGAIVAVNDQDEVVYAFDSETDEPLDPADYEIAAPADDPYSAEIDERLAELERRVAEPRPQAELLVTRGLPQADMERFGEDMDRQRRDLERLLDRKLTLGEARALGQAMLDDFEAGAPRADIYSAAERIGGLADLDDENPVRARQARQDYMTQRLAEGERIAAAPSTGDDLLGELPPPSETALDPDLDDRQQRVEYMTQRMTGQAAPLPTYYGED